MTKAQFLLATIRWADNILAAPDYTMPNGRSAHDVAREQRASAVAEANIELPRYADGSIAWEA
jgi:hypothetical protein